MTKNLLALTLACLILSLPSLGLSQPKFYPDDPLWEDNDTLIDVPEAPEETDLSDLFDRFGHIARDWGRSPHGSEAQNVNTLDEVPNSSWFTNRHGLKRMSLDEVVRGPDRSDGPNPDETWSVFRSKSQGLTPGFHITDSKGDRYVIKLDPVGVPELSSAAEVIATKLFYAMGFNVPENYIVRYNPDNFEVVPGTQTEDSWGDKVALTGFRFRRLLRRVPRAEDGTMRVTASKYIDGLPIGPFRYYETRSDDPNDVVPHEDRRELRGLRLIAAWLNHDDTRAQNTQNSWVEENGKHYIRHYLIDFGSTFGSGSVDLQLPNLSFHYWLDGGLVKKNALGFGFHVPKYRKVEWPNFPEFESVGRWESEAFEPEEWRNDYPNPAFVRMTARDAFWAAKLIMAFSEEELGAIVQRAEYSDGRQAEYFLKTLIERQQKCGRFGINAINPLDEFQLEGGELSFANLSEKYGFAGESQTRYSVVWSSYDNEENRRRPLSEARSQDETRLQLPSDRSGNDFLVVEIRSVNEEFPHWNRPVDVYLRPRGSGYEIVGIDRASPEMNTFPMN